MKHRIENDAYLLLVPSDPEDEDSEPVNAGYRVFSTVHITHYVQARTVIENQDGKYPKAGEPIWWVECVWKTKVSSARAKVSQQNLTRAEAIKQAELMAWNIGNRTFESASEFLEFTRPYSV